jgi:hypothetical protein
VKHLSVVAVLLAIFLVTSCRPAAVESPTSTLEPQSTTVPTATPESDLPFKPHMNTSKDSYLQGEEIQYGISITDLSSDMTIDPFPPASQIKLVGQDGAVVSSPAGTRTQDIIAGAPFYHTIGSWNQKDNNGNQVPPGRYELIYVYTLIERSTYQKYTANLKAEFQIVPR